MYTTTVKKKKIDLVVFDVPFVVLRLCYKNNIIGNCLRVHSSAQHLDLNNYGSRCPHLVISIVVYKRP